MSESLIATGYPRTSPGTQLSGPSCSDLSDETRHSQLRRKRTAYEEARTLQAGPERCAQATPESNRGQVSEQSVQGVIKTARPGRIAATKPELPKKVTANPRPWAATRRSSRAAAARNRPTGF